jgi:CRISPR/Cas system CSM-associated protein Csm2 small subunit
MPVMARKGVSIPVTAQNYTGGTFKSVQNGLMGVKRAQDMVTRSNRGFMRGMSANRRIVQQVGMQVSDLGVQIAGGQSALLSLTQNVPQVIQMFGAWGGILAGVITLLGTFTLVMVKSGVAFNDIASQFGSVSDEMMAFGKVMVSVREVVYDAINVILNNLDQLLITIGVIASFFAGKLVMSLVGFTGWVRLASVALLVMRRRGLGAAAALVWKHTVVKGLTGALRVLRGVLASLGIPALIFAVGYLAERFWTLRKATGSWGAALGLVGELAQQVFTQIPQIMWAAYLRLLSINAGVVEAGSKTFADIADFAGRAGNIMVGSFVVVARGIAEIFTTIAVDIHNVVGDMVNRMVNSFIIGINQMSIELRKLGINAPFLLTDQMNPIDRNTSRDDSTLGDRLGTIANESYSADYMGSMANGLREVSDAARGVREQLKGMSDAAFATAAENIPVWQEILDILAKADAEGKKIDMRDWFGGKDDAKEKLKDFQKSLERMIDDAQQAVRVLSATLADPVIDMSVDKFIESLDRIQNLQPRHYTEALAGIEALRPKLKSLAGPMRQEIEALQEILNSDLEKTDKDSFFAQTQEIMTNIQEMLRPMRQEMQDIIDIDPKLKELDFDIFEDSMVDAVKTTRTKMDDLRQLLSEFFEIPAIKLPEIDTDPVKKSLSDIEAFMKRLGEGIESSIKDNFKSMITGAKNLRDALADILNRIADMLLDFALDSLFDSIKNSGIGGSIGGGIGDWFSNLLSFDGGGFTGNGPRSGGVDGKGGFMAILHPKETVSDHTKANHQNAMAVATGYTGASQAPVYVDARTENYFNGVTYDEVMRDVGDAMDRQEKKMTKELPGKINRHKFNQGRGMAK